MATWKKVVVSGSAAELSGLTVTSTIVGDLTGDVTGNVTGNVTGTAGSTTGNAATATALETARNINGVSFDGTANITVTAAGSTLSDTVPVSKGGTNLTTIGSALQVLRVNAGGTALEYGAASEGDVTGVVSSTTNQLVVTDPTGPEPSLAIQTAAIANAGTALATADQIHTFVTTQGDTMAAGTSGNAATATNVAYTGLTGTVPTWDQDTTGDAGGLSGTPDISVGTLETSGNVILGDATTDIVTVNGDLVVKGTASFENTENLLVKDRFITLASGSTGATAGDGGIIIETSNANGGEGPAFAWQNSSARWGVSSLVQSDATSYSPDAFLSAVLPAAAANTVATINAIDSNYNKNGNIYTSTATGNDIWIYS